MTTVTGAWEPERAIGDDLRELLKEARDFAVRFAIRNPKWEHNGEVQDPSGVHALIDRIDAALAAPAEPPAQAKLSAERDDYRARYETLKRRVDEQSSSLGYEDEEALAEQLARDAALRADNERLRAALTELVACKTLKAEVLWAKAIDPPQQSALEAEYARRQPLAWAAARAALEHKHG